MEEPLRCCSILVGPENHFPCPRFRACQGMLCDKQCIVYAVELNCLTQGSFDDYRMSEDLSRIATDRGSLVEQPDFRGFGSDDPTYSRKYKHGCHQNQRSHHPRFLQK